MKKKSIKKKSIKRINKKSIKRIKKKSIKRIKKKSIKRINKKSIKRINKKSIDGFDFIHSLKQELEELEEYKEDLIELIKIFGELSNSDVKEFIEEAENMTSLEEIEENIKEFDNEIQKLINNKSDKKENKKENKKEKLKLKESTFLINDFYLSNINDLPSAEFQKKKIEEGIEIKGDSIAPQPGKTLYEKDWVYITPEKKRNEEIESIHVKIPENKWIIESPKKN
jgi:hypothetical protein